MRDAVGILALQGGEDVKCDECTILRDHYPRDPEVRLERVRLFSPGCIYCGARYIQWIQRKSGRPADARKRECRRVLERWKAHFHDEAELRALAKSPTWAVEPALGREAR